MLVSISVRGTACALGLRVRNQGDRDPHSYFALPLLLLVQLVLAFVLWRFASYFGSWR